MPSNNPSKLKTRPSGTGKSVAVKEPVPLMSATAPVEGASTGNGTVNNPPGADIKPPFPGGYEIPA